MPRRKKADREKKARESLIKTIAKIHNLEPTLGAKWRENMLVYYVDRLAELLLHQSGFRVTTPYGIREMAAHIRRILDD